MKRARQCCGAVGWVTHRASGLLKKVLPQELPKSFICVGRVLNRPEFSGRHDFRAEKFGRQCAKSGSHAVGLQENSSKKIT